MPKKRLGETPSSLGPSCYIRRVATFGKRKRLEEKKFKNRKIAKKKKTKTKVDRTSESRGGAKN